MMRVTNNQMFSRSLNGMLNLQADIQKYQLQVATGKRIQKAADDPVAAAQSLNLGERLGALTQYDRNANLATLRLSEQESAIEGTQNILQRVRELILHSKNRSLTAVDRRFLAADVGERLNEVLSLANQRNASNEYGFAGTAADTVPFTADPAGTVLYHGNQHVRELEIADGRSIAESFSGAEVFMAIRNGNGSFVTSLRPANTGTGRVINGNVTDIAAFASDDFRVVFTTANTYDVINDTTGTTVQSAQSYTDGSAIAFNGVAVAVTGSPAVGDEFLIGPSQNQSVFATIAKARQDMAVDLVSSEQIAAFSFNLDRALGDIDLAMDSLNSIRAQIGARQNAIESQTAINANASVQLETVKSKLEDVDLVEAIGHLARQTQALEAAQQAFVRVQGLSLFNFLG